MQIVPTRYKSAAVRKQMGRIIAGADPDDLLAAFLWTSEGWLLRDYFDKYHDEHKQAERENTDARRRRLADWSDSLCPTSQKVKDAVDAAFLTLEAALDPEEALLYQSREECRTATLNMGYEFGFDHCEFFDRDGVEIRAASPVEELDEDGRLVTTRRSR